MPTDDYANSPNMSRSEEIIQSILDGTEYDEPARSRIEYLLKELKAAIEGGGGGGGVTSYAPLTEKPKIDNHTLQAGNNTSSDLGLQTKLTFDSAPTESSTKPVTSGGVYTALGTKANADNVYKLALSNADLLPANTDLDNVKTVGCYYVYESTIVTTITHRPTGNTSAFRVAVELAAGKGRPRQIYQEFNSYDKYIRYETSSGTWAAWKKVEADLSTKQDTISDLPTIRSGAALGATAVQPVSGKGLSTNDYTTSEKEKLAGIEAQANKTVIDSALSESSTNPVQNKVVKSALDSKQATLTTAQLAAVNSGITAEKLAQDENNISKAGAVLVELVDGGAKNKLSIGNPSSVPTGLTCAKNDDGTYTVSGTLAAANSISFSIDTIDGDLVLSGCPEGGGNDTYLLRITKSGSQVTGSVDTGNGSDVFTMDGTGYALGIRLAAGTYNDLVFEPMICSKTEWDISRSYQPYRPSYQELYEMVLALQSP